MVGITNMHYVSFEFTYVVDSIVNFEECLNRNLTWIDFLQLNLDRMYTRAEKRKQ